MNAAASEPWAEVFLPPPKRPWPAHTEASSHPREDHRIVRKARLEGTTGGLQTNLLFKAGSATLIKHIQPCYAFCHIAQLHVQAHSSSICECFCLTKNTARVIKITLNKNCCVNFSLNWSVTWHRHKYSQFTTHLNSSLPYNILFQQ